MITVRIVNSENVGEAFISSVKKLDKLPGVCVLLTKPCSTMQAALKKKGVDISNTLFIDTVEESEADNAVHVQAGNLTAISITINQALQSLPLGKKFLIIDSLSALSVESSVQAVQRFAIFLLERVRKWNAETVIIVAKESTDDRLLSILEQGADKVEKK